MKKNKLFIAGLVTVFVALVSLTLVSSTWAKYTSTATGSDQARVAKWAWQFNGTDIDLASAKSVTFNLFNNVADTSDADETDDENVKNGNGDEVIIAPGTKGEFSFSVTNASEVTGLYDISFTCTNAGNVPLEFSLDGTNWKSDITQLDFTAETVAAGNTSTAAKLYWRWDFDGDDTQLGIKASLDTVTVTATVSMEQVD